MGDVRSLPSFLVFLQSLPFSSCRMADVVESDESEEALDEEECAPPRPPNLRFLEGLLVKAKREIEYS